MHSNGQGVKVEMDAWFRRVLGVLCMAMLLYDCGSDMEGATGHTPGNQYSPSPRDPYINVYFSSAEMRPIW